MNQAIILAINPGSTSTKLAVFKDDQKLFDASLSHSVDELGHFSRIIDQEEFRTRLVLDFLEHNHFDMNTLTAVVGRGGLLPPLESGTYRVNHEMVKYLRESNWEHASNLGALIAIAIAGPAGIPAFIVDPVVVDEMHELARITGVPEIRRVSILHALNQKAAAREAARMLKKNYNACNLVVAHMGGGISIGAHQRGRIVDVNNALNGDGPFSPERAGSVPSWPLIEWALSGDLSRDELKKRITGKGGVVAHLGTNDMREVERRVDQGDEKAEFILRAMAYGIAKEIGAMATVMSGKVDAVVMTGGIAYDKRFVGWIRERTDFLAPAILLPGEDELRSLVLGGLRVLNGEEEAREWSLNHSNPF
ncbi:MAG: butyrate kinase [Acidobacteriota bacterium]|jgi:butyrate kinase|nr:butyrate kinase [Acidobacteriota bacterium]